MKFGVTSLVLLVVPAAYSQRTAQYVIETIAGAGGNVGDGGLALQATFRSPAGLAFDSLGRLLVSDTLQHRIRRIDAAGIITTIAGTGDRGVKGDDGLAVEAALWEPKAVVVDRDGSILIADGSARIRKITPDGRINTIAGNGVEGWSGDGGPALEASIGIPGGMALDAAGNIYVSDVLRSVVRKISNGRITTVAGTGTSGFSGDGGPAANAQLFAPLGLAVNRDGNLLIADYGNLRLRELLPDNAIRTVAGGGRAGDGKPASTAFLGYPCAVAADGNGVLYIGESGSRIRKVDSAGLMTTIASSEGPQEGQHRPAKLSASSVPCGLVLDGKGGLIVSESGNDQITRITLTPPEATLLAGRGRALTVLSPREVQLYLPQGLAMGPGGDLVFADLEGHRVYRLSLAGAVTVVAGTGRPGFSGDGGPAAEATLTAPASVAVDKAGNIWIADSLNRRIRKVSTSNVITTVASGEAADPADRISIPNEIAVDSLGSVYFTEQNQHTVRKIDSSGKVTLVSGGSVPGFSGDGGPARQAKLNGPLGLAVDGADRVYIADTSNHAVRRVDPTGIIVTVAGHGSQSGDGIAATQSTLLNPIRVSVDAGGRILIAEEANDPPSGRIRLVDENGMISTIAGNGLPGTSGDGGLASSASLGSTRGIATDAYGDVFLIDSGNRILRKLSPLKESRLEIKGGDRQRGPVKSTLPEPLAVAVLDKRGIGVPGVMVQFRVVSGDAVLPTEPAETDQTGIALAPLETGQEAGPIVAEALADGLGSARFEAEATPVTAPQMPENLDYSIATIAGNATAAAQAGPYFDEAGGFAFDTDGMLYVTDSGANAIRKIAPDGRCTTIVGIPELNEYCQHAEQPAPSPAAFRAPGGIAVSAEGDLYVADRLNHQVQKIAKSGTVTRFAGTGVPGFSGDKGPAESAQLASPSFVWIDREGAVFISDTGNRRVRKVSPDGTIDTYAGNGEIGTGGDGDFAINVRFSSPAGIAQTPDGVIFIADSGTNEVKAVSPDGIVKIVAGTGRAPTAEEQRQTTLPASLDTPTGIAVDQNGSIYIGERGRVRQIKSGAAAVAIGSKDSGDVLWLTSHGGSIYVLDTDQGVVRRLESDGSLKTIVGTRFQGDGGPAEAASLSWADGVVIDGDGNLYFSDHANHRVRKIGADGKIETIAGTGQAASSGDGGPAVRAGLDTPAGLALHPDGSLYVAEYRGARIRRIGTDGIISTVAGTGLFGNSGNGGPGREATFTGPSGLAIDKDGNVFISDALANRVRKIAPSGVITRVAGMGQYGAADIGIRGTETSLNGPTALVLDESGNLLIADTLNNRVLKLYRSGAIQGIAGTGQRRPGANGGPAVDTPLNRPAGIALDRAGNLYIADESQRVRKVSPSGAIVTIAGRGPAGFSGDGGPATAASLSNPGIIAIGANDEVYFSDRGNRRIRRLSATPAK